MLIRWFRVVAVVEAVSYLCLIGASVAKRALDIPVLVPIVGPIHGVIFLVYFVIVVFVREELGWDTGRTLIALFAAVVPFGGIWVERKLLLGNP